MASVNCEAAVPLKADASFLFLSQTDEAGPPRALRESHVIQAQPPGRLVLRQRRFRAGGRGPALRVTNLWAIPSKSRNTSRLTRDKRTSTTL